MGMLDGMIEQLEKSEIVQKTIKDFENVRQILVATVNRFDSRFGDAHKLNTAIAEAVLRVEGKCDSILFLLQHPHQGAPAGEDGLMQALAAGGTEMVIQKFDPIPVVNEVEVSQFDHDKVFQGL